LENSWRRGDIKDEEIKGERRRERRDC